MELLKRFWTEEDGMGTVEIVMIIAALMCIALLFRKQVFDFAPQMPHLFCHSPPTDSHRLFLSDSWNGIRLPE